MYIIAVSTIVNGVNNVTFLEFWLALPPGGKAKFARETGIKLPRLSSIAHGRIRCGAVTALAIERATRGIVPKESLAPHVNWTGA